VQQLLGSNRYALSVSAVAKQVYDLLARHPHGRAGARHRQKPTI